MQNLTALPATAALAHCGCGAHLIVARTGALICQVEDCDMVPTWAGAEAVAAEDGGTLATYHRTLVVLAA